MGSRESKTYQRSAFALPLSPPQKGTPYICHPPRLTAGGLSSAPQTHVLHPQVIQEEVVSDKSKAKKKNFGGKLVGGSGKKNKGVKNAKRMG